MLKSTGEDIRTIPGTMATQHPDNARAPYWGEATKPFISAAQEIAEAVECFKNLGMGEYMWDWEGKYADPNVINKLYGDYLSYFQEHPLGEDKFLTFRIPNMWEEHDVNLLGPMGVILSGEDFARKLQFPHRPLFEVILPMTERAEQLIHMQRAFQEVARIKATELTPNMPSKTANTDTLELIPLVESVGSQQAIGTLLKQYVGLHEKHFGKRPEYIRPFLARSDPALASGLLATVIANKLALSRIYEFQTETGIPVFPISGVGSLPFRGGLTPDTVESYLKEYPGMRTVSIQSSFRYDYPITAVKAAIHKLETELPKQRPHTIDQQVQKRLETIGKQSEQYYQATLEAIAADMQPFFAAVPKRRERKQHIGLLGYGRSMGTQRLPRAITFTAAFYSIGVPPEFIGIGRTLKEMSNADMTLLKSEYHNLVQDFVTAGHYLNRDNLATLAKRNPAWKEIEKDISIAEDVLDVTFGPKTNDEKAHRNLSSNSLLYESRKARLSELMNELATLRRSLG